MKKFFLVLAKPFRYAICFSFVLTLFSVYVLLDAFVIPKVYAVINDTPAISDNSDSIDTSEKNTNALESETTESVKDEEINGDVITDMSYSDSNIDLKIEKVEENGVVFYMAELKISDAKYLKTAFARGVFGKNITEKTSVMAEENNAIFAINGDYCGFRDDGVVMRNGQLLREKPRKNRYGLIIDESGNLLFISEKELTKEKLSEVNAVQCFAFGPTLVVDGEVSICETGISKNYNPRTAIGQIEPLHYIFIVVDGRTKTSRGMKFPELAEEFKKRDCMIAYNLDGGGSSTMWFNGEVVNYPTDGKKAGEREISDIIYIGY